MFVESFKFFDPPTTKWRLFKFFAKLNGNYILMANFSKLRKYQTFGLIELRDLSKGQLADRIFKLWKSYVYDYRAIKCTTFEILTFYFSQLSYNFFQKFYEKTSGFKIDSESTDKVLPFSRFIYNLKFLDNETTNLWFFFEICTEERFAS